MSEIVEKRPPQPWARKTAALAAATALLVALGDLLLFDVEPGLNLFAFTLGIAAVLTAFAAARPRNALLAFAAAMVLALPLLETPSLPGLLLAALGLATATLVGTALLPPRFEQFPDVLLRFGLLAPFRLPADLLARRAAASDDRPGRRLLRGLLAWILPVVLGLVFIMLFTAANPLIEIAISWIRADVVLDLLGPARLVFWLLLATAIWPLLRPALLPTRSPMPAATAAPAAEFAWFGHAAVLRSLLVFNALFAVQTVLDLAFLWGGVALPEGMSYADYAHRGAYPLVVTALLAAGFVLAAMRRHGPGDRSPLIRGLVYAFIGQNVLLCLSSILRLDLYVEVYSLTELRLTAGIWMALVACGLVLILLRIWLRRSNAWLVASNLLALLFVLYASALLDISALIARFNVEHSRELSGEGPPLDLDYLAGLGPSVLPALDQFLARADARSSRYHEAQNLRLGIAERARRMPTDPRSWSWRQQRLVDYLAQHPIAIGAPAPQNRGGVTNQQRP